LKKLLYIARYQALAVLLLLLSALTPVMAQNVTNKNEITVLTTDSLSGDTYKWELYSDSTVNFAVVPGVTSGPFATFVGSNAGSKVSVKWLETGTYFFKITAYNATGCTENLDIGMMKVLPPLPIGTIDATVAVCSGDPVKLTVELTEIGPWSFTYTDGTTTWTETNVTTSPWVVTIIPAPKTNTDYWITSVTNKDGTNVRPSGHVTQIVNPKRDQVIFLENS